MSFCNVGKNVKDADCDDYIAIAKSIRQAEIIAKVLNHYFNTQHFTSNESVAMMHRNTSSSLSKIADFIEKHEYTAEQIIEYLREISDEISAQALVVSLRDELKFDSPTQEGE